MPIVLVVHWTAKPGEEAHLANVLQIMVSETREEPGCIYYDANRSTEDPRRFLIYEIYRDAEAQKAHEGSAHFRRHVLEDALPRLESRVRTFFQPV
jgi:autoinducer 2-degrading protein